MSHHNGVSERRNQTLLDMVRSMMSLAELPKSFWGYALETAVYALNRVPSKSVDVTPYEIWYNKKPILSHMKIWGCPAYVKRIVSDKLSVKNILFNNTILCLKVLFYGFYIFNLYYIIFPTFFTNC